MSLLAPAWRDLLGRRPSFAEALAPLGRVIEAWDAAPSSVAPDARSVEHAATLWSRGEPLLVRAQPAVQPESIEPLLLPALDALADIEDTQPFAEAWDRGEISPYDLMPVAGRLGAIDVQQRCGLSQEAFAFLALAGLRPVLVAHFAHSRTLIDAALWDHGLCPCCGAPPGFADLVEDGRRQLACHLCDARWTLARLTCPFCANRNTDDFVRLLAEGADESYAIAACKACGGYLKEIDRRARWNAGPALVEDWGSPHLDLVAQRREFWRPLPAPTVLAGPSASEARPS